MSQELYYPDGGVFLRAEDTLFRVYSGILAQHSPIFSDLFTLPQPPDDEAFDGCPVIRLQDSAQDLLRFLKVLHEWRYVARMSLTMTHANLFSQFSRRCIQRHPGSA